MAKIRAGSGYGREVSEIFRGRVMTLRQRCIPFSLAGTGDKTGCFLASLRDVAKIVEVARSGVVGLSRR
ncbi:hypothetical protein KCP78_24685 [Salmonella enterica subsp. enterica]|nr:hypothetical protein KCP78_24685 [Salmonella enterica subsp. enterica]